MPRTLIDIPRTVAGTRIAAGTRTTTASRIVNDPQTFIDYILSLSGLVAYYPLNETSGSTADNAEGTAALDGTITGATVGQDGRVGKAYSFDGVGDDVNLGNNSLFSNLSAITLLALVNWDGTVVGDGGTFLRKGGGADAYLWRVKSDGTIESGLLETTFVSSIGTDVLSSNAWNLVALTYDGVTKIHYINTTTDNWTDNAALTFNETNNLFIGSSNGSSEYFSGLIQHAAIFNRALTQNEITNLSYLAGLL